MIESPEEFAEIVNMQGKQRKKTLRRLQRFQHMAHHRPGLYQLYVFGYAMIGYGFLLGLLVMIILSAAGLMALAFFSLQLPNRQLQALGLLCVLVGICTLLGVVISIASALTFTPSPPVGIIIRQRDAPALFQCLERLSKNLKIPSIDWVLLTGEFNAAVWLAPRAAGIGGTRTYLMIGLPLLQALSPQQMTGVLAHELGHVSGKLNKFEQWIYAQNAKWSTVSKSLTESPRLISTFLSPLANWYMHHLTILTYAMMRAVEFEADKLSAKQVGNQCATEYLIQVHVLGKFLHLKFWPEIYESVQTVPLPPEDIYFRLRSALKSPLPPNEYAGWLHWSLAQQPGIFDTHPSLRERLQALGTLTQEDPDTYSLVPDPSDELTAASFFLGDGEDDLTSVLSAAWKNAAQQPWVNSSRDSDMARKVLTDLQRKQAMDELKDFELWALARLTEKFQGRRAAYATYRAYLETHLEEPRANFHFGRTLVEESEESGVPYVQFAMDADPFLTAEGCQILCAYYYDKNRHDDARPLEERAARHAHEMTDAADERMDIEPGDELQPHALPEERLAPLISKFEQLEFIERAFMGIKTVEHFPNLPPYVLGIQMKGELDPEEIHLFREWLDFDAHLIVVVPTTANNRRVIRRLRRLSNALIYERKK